MTNPTEPTLTCSEVVERLHAECVSYSPLRETEFDAKKAEAILHSWRERRVQELDVDEDAAESFFRSYVDENWISLWRRVNLGGLVQHQSQMALVITEAYLAYMKSAEWREQIRKGAKHE